MLGSATCGRNPVPLGREALLAPERARIGGMKEPGTSGRDFTRAIEEQLDALYGLALRLVKNDADAEDLVAETVTKAWLAIDTLENPARFRAWIFRILRNHFISEYRKESIRPRTVSIDEREDDSSEATLVSLLNRQPDEFLQWWANPETEVANRLLGEQIMAAIEELPENYRETILLVNVDGLGYDEAAAVLGVPAGTIRSRMKRGRTLLQKALWTQARDAGLIREQGASR